MTQKTTTFCSMVILTVLLTGVGGVDAQDKSDDIRMFLEIGTLSEVIIPEPYISVQIPVQIVEMRDVPGRNNRVITFHPVVPQKTKTNVRIYTQQHAFNIKLFLNYPRARITESLDLADYLTKDTAAANGSSANGGHPAGNTGLPSQDAAAQVRDLFNDIEREKPAVPSDFTIEKLLTVKPNLLKPNEHAPAIVRNRIILAIDDIFHHKGKLVFKASVVNRSNVPYNILDFNISYKEKRGVPGINQREVKSITLPIFYEEYTARRVEPGETGHIIYVSTKLSPKDKGYFNCVLVERNGARNFSFDIPSFIE